MADRELGQGSVIRSPTTETYWQVVEIEKAVLSFDDVLVLRAKVSGKRRTVKRGHVAHWEVSK